MQGVMLLDGSLIAAVESGWDFPESGECQRDVVGCHTNGAGKSSLHESSVLRAQKCGEDPTYEVTAHWVNENVLACTVAEPNTVVEDGDWMYAQLKFEKCKRVSTLGARLNVKSRESQEKTSATY